MADVKISALPAATTPLGGTEVLPIVQSGSTVKVSVADVTAGRTVNVASLISSGNVGVGQPNPTTNLWVGSSGGGFGTATPDAISLGNTFANSAGDAAKIKLRIFQDNTPLYYGFGVSSGLMETHVPSGAGAAWYIGGSEKLRLADSGNVGVNEAEPNYLLDVNGAFGFTPGASVTPVDNGDVVFELTNNTTLTVKAKGSDGVVRSGTITLAP